MFGSLNRQALLALAIALAGALVPAAGSANSDPHRSLLAASPFTLAGLCSFPVHFEFPVANEYGTFTSGPAGSTIIDVTGSQVVTVSNTVNGHSVTLNASGPATITVFPDGSQHFAGRGMGVIFATNLTQYGFPSGIVHTAGPAEFTTPDGLSVSSFTTIPHVLLDVCAAIS